MGGQKGRQLAVFGVCLVGAMTFHHFHHGFLSPGNFSALASPTAVQAGAVSTSIDRIMQSQAKSVSISEIQKNDTADPTLAEHEQLIGKISTLSLDVLRRAYYKKIETIEKDAIERRFQRPEAEADRITHRDLIFHLLQDTLGQADYWFGSSMITLGAKTISMTLLFNFYDGANVSKTSKALDVKDPKDLCWSLETFFGDEPSEHWAGSSSCLGSVTHEGDAYYIVQMLNLDSVEPYYTHLAVPIPLRAAQTGSLELLETKSQKWRKLNRMDWVPVSRAQAEQIKKEHRKFNE